MLFYKKKMIFLPLLDARLFKFQKINPFFLITFIIIFSGFFFITSNFINQKNKDNEKNFKEITKTTEFSNLSNFLISKINSPYEEIDYTIKNNDSIEKILKNYKVRVEDIKNISIKLKEKKLVNIYSGRKLNLIIKKLDGELNTVINLVYPLNNTTSIEIRKSKNNFIINENILQLNKREVVIRNTIKNNLYSSAVNAGIEPNIIIEFARIFGFEVDFQRDIRKGDWFEILYERFEDDNNKVRDTGKIIYASMFVNGEEINLYNFKYNN